MRFGSGISDKYKRSVETALQTILALGNDFHRKLAVRMMESEMLIRVLPVKKVNASGVTGLIDSGDTNDLIADGRIGLSEAFGQIHITIAEETIDTGGQRGCEGTLVHEGRHAYDFARTIESFSHAGTNPLSIFDPTLYELEWEAHKTAGDYMLRVGRGEYIDEGLQLMILGRDSNGACFVNEEGIQCRLRDSYGLDLKGDMGRRASELLGLQLP